MNSPFIRILLFPPAKIYQFVVRARIACYTHRLFRTRKLSAPVISVGNITLGGTGKTPCVAYLANLLRREGDEVAILSRGYKRTGKGLVEVSDGLKVLCGPRESGDEPYLLAKSCPGVRVVVDQDRYAAGRWLEGRAPVSVFILDDGYQHLRLARDLNLVLIDATERLDDAEMAPSGRLREPLEELRRADAVIVTRSDQPFDLPALENALRRYTRPLTPIFQADHEVVSLRSLIGGENVRPSSFAGLPVAVLSGIARPERLISDLARLEMKIVYRRDFPDHHRYERSEFLDFTGQAKAAGAMAIMTTDKDDANLPHDLLPAAGLPVYAAQIEFRCREEEALKELILRAVRR